VIFGRLRLSPALLIVLLGCGAHPSVLRVCADPNNLPFSNRREEGFENRLADLVAHELKAKVRYTWQAQRRGFIRNTLAANVCDVVMGMPAGADRVLTTRPYYRSTYVFVYRKDRGLHIHSLDDPTLRTLKIGVQLVGDDYANTPPVHALGRRGIVKNLVGFRVVGDYSEQNPPARIIDAVASGQVDLAIAWGPMAGFFAKTASVPIEVVPVVPEVDPPGLRFAFDISMAVRQGDEALKAKLDSVLDRRRPTIDSMLGTYGVPLLNRS
jgi:quinoprotein dehydrogenase-associated probable ABC transporter substrate-binding protein